MEGRRTRLETLQANAFGTNIQLRTSLSEGHPKTDRRQTLNLPRISCSAGGKSCRVLLLAQ